MCVCVCGGGGGQGGACVRGRVGMVVVNYKGAGFELLNSMSLPRALRLMLQYSGTVNTRSLPSLTLHFAHAQGSRKVLHCPKQPLH